MISLIIPPKDQISRVSKMLADEFGTASNIKSRVNRLSVLGAITSVQQRLKLYNKGKKKAPGQLFIQEVQGSNLALANLLNASSFSKKAS